MMRRLTSCRSAISWIGSGLVVKWLDACAAFLPFGFLPSTIADDFAPACGSRREHSVISHQVKARRRNDARQFFHQLQGLIDHVRGAVAPAALEPIEQPAIVQARQAL